MFLTIFKIATPGLLVTALLAGVVLALGPSGLPPSSLAQEPVGGQAKPRDQEPPKKATDAELLAPKRVRLVYKDTPLEEAVADFKKQSGCWLEFSDPEGKLKGRKVTLDTGDVTFWKALYLFCRAVNLVETVPPPLDETRPPPSPRAIYLSDGRRAPFMTDDDRTALRIRVLDIAPRRSGELRVALEVRPQPGLDVLDVLSIEVKQATDLEGQRLEQVGPTGATVFLKPEGKGVKELSGTIKVRLLSTSQPATKSVICEVPFALEFPVPK